MSDPLTFLATVAVRTSTLRVGTGIFQLPGAQPDPGRRAGRHHRPALERPRVARCRARLVAARVPGARLGLPRARRAHGRGARDPAAGVGEREHRVRRPLLAVPRAHGAPASGAAAPPAAVGRRGRGCGRRPRRPARRRVDVRPGAVAGQGPVVPGGLPRVVRRGRPRRTTGSCGATRGSAKTTGRSPRRCCPPTSTG